MAGFYKYVELRRRVAFANFSETMPGLYAFDHLVVRVPNFEEGVEAYSKLLPRLQLKTGGHSGLREHDGLREHEGMGMKMVSGYFEVDTYHVNSGHRLSLIFQTVALSRSLRQRAKTVSSCRL